MKKFGGVVTLVIKFTLEWCFVAPITIINLFFVDVQIVTVPIN